MTAPNPARTTTPAAVRRTGLLLALGGLLVVLDTTVTTVAIPAMVADLNSPLTTIQWVTTGYLLGIVAVIPLAGWAVDRFGARRVYVLALLTFTLFSALAGAAWSGASLAAFRVLQGLGGGLLNPVGQAIGMRAVPKDHRGRLMSLLGLPLIIGPVLGPPVAGWLVDAASWRWIFLLNVPLGLLAAALCAHLLPFQPATPTTTRRPDWTGLAELSTAAVLVVLGATLTARPPIPLWQPAACLLTGALLGALFLRRSRPPEAIRSRRPDSRRRWTTAELVRPACSTGPHPEGGGGQRAPALIDLGLLRHSTFRAGLAVLAAFGAAYFGAMSILPIFVQGVRGDPASLAGTLAIPAAIAVGATVQVATRLVDRAPAGRIVLTGVLTALTGAAVLLTATSTDAPYPAIVAGAVLLGIGSGATLMPTMTVSLRDLDGPEIPRGTPLLALVQQLSSAIGVAMVATALTALLSTPTSGGGIATMLALDPVSRAAQEPTLARAVGSAYLPVLLLLTLSLLAARALRRTAPAAPATHPPG